MLELPTSFRYCIGHKRAFARPMRWGGTTLAVDWTIREVLNWTRGYFEGAGITQPRLEAEILLAHALEVDRLHLYLSPDKPLTLDERDRYRAYIQKRRTGTPLQHLIGEVAFLGLRFRVRRDALIPRAETEELLDRVLHIVPRDREVRCLDLGTGSGVIAICLARYLPKAEIVAVEISEPALALARENATTNGVLDRVAFMQGDWFDAVSGSFDFILSNPPYVATEEMDALPQEVREHEPHVALDGGCGGIERIGDIVSRAPEFLEPGGRLFLEIGHTQGARVRQMMEKMGFVEVIIERDLAGRERYATARREG